MGEDSYTREECLALLARKKAELEGSGESRLPQRSDFTDTEVVAIKAFLGPWPRALEAAGLKEPRKEDRLRKNREKRARAEKRRKQARRATRIESDASHEGTEGTENNNG